LFFGANKAEFEEYNGERNAEIISKFVIRKAQDAVN
jgi:hypothetical protein